MSSVPIFPAITLAVGQQVEVSLTVSSAALSAIWLACDNPPVVAPASMSAALSTWPYEIALAGGAGVYTLRGLSPGTAMLSFVDEIDPPDPETAGGPLGTLEIIVTAIEDGETGSGAVPFDGTMQPLSILEPIIIILVPVPVPPAGGQG